MQDLLKTLDETIYPGDSYLPFILSPDAFIINPIAETKVGDIITLGKYLRIATIGSRMSAGSSITVFFRNLGVTDPFVLAIPSNGHFVEMPLFIDLPPNSFGYVSIIPNVIQAAPGIKVRLTGWYHD